MNTGTLDNLRLQLNCLSDKERAELEQELVTSLNGPSEESVDAAWGTEIARRIERFRRGEARLLTRDEFQRNLRN